MKKILFALAAITPILLFGNEAHADVQTDILERTVNFLIFIAVVYYLLADKLKEFFANRTQSIQDELDKVQELLKASEKKIEDSKQEVENAKKVASEIVSTANEDVEAIKKSIDESVEQEITYLLRSVDEKIELETRKVKREVTQNVLDQLLSDENIAISQNELAEIILKKVA